jgi:hypothetical protein
VGGKDSGGLPSSLPWLNGEATAKMICRTEFASSPRNRYVRSFFGWLVFFVYGPGKFGGREGTKYDQKQMEE